MRESKYLLTMPYKEYTASWVISKNRKNCVDVEIVLGNYNYYEFVDYSKYIESMKVSFKFILQNQKDDFEFDTKSNLEYKDKFRIVSGRSEKDMCIAITLCVYDNLQWFSDEFNDFINNDIKYNNSCLINT